ncbi:hypothetical protein C0995_013390 [Termitomyces sp. Mi166|nr:hypothetical protein C0995_013390 [Termitomyces sp. Mi166\
MNNVFILRVDFYDEPFNNVSQQQGFLPFDAFSKRNIRRPFERTKSSIHSIDTSAYNQSLAEIKRLQHLPKRATQNPHNVDFGRAHNIDFGRAHNVDFGRTYNIDFGHAHNVNFSHAHNVDFGDPETSPTQLPPPTAQGSSVPASSAAPKRERFYHSVRFGSSVPSPSGASCPEYHVRKNTVIPPPSAPIPEAAVPSQANISKKPNAKPLRPKVGLTSARNLFAIDYLTTHPETTETEFANVWKTCDADTKKKYTDLSKDQTKAKKASTQLALSNSN